LRPRPERAALVRLLQDVDVEDELTDLLLQARHLLVLGRFLVAGQARRAFTPAAKNCSFQRSISATVRPCLRAASAAEVSRATSDVVPQKIVVHEERFQSEA
jgi:hypothetical protein